ncbi:DUF692 domain-containing protein [Streptomyces sp. SID9124]|uniref:DUF692 domain-containing protein n=1 Tax=Streptomyces sp. SID9124 TaxID=2706108 RepID=UPI0013DF697F|nr:DUF692 domain-containing protein [Streptomyces sp. SID9124]NED13051.1 DUF692 domain-containing protein [Streptomyces sp. SID9124]
MIPAALAAAPELGVGLGYREELHDAILTHRDHIGWLEIVADRYLDRPGQQLLRTLRESFVLVTHGLEMSIGSYAPLDTDYVDAVAALADAVDAPWASDHLCFTREEGVELHELAPVLRTPERAKAVAARAQRVQERLGRPFLLENISYYVDFPSEMSEPEFITAILEACDCGLLLDLNNLAVNAANHGFDAYAYLDALPLERVVQVHLAGNTPRPDDSGLRPDRHNGPVADEVFALLEHLERRHHVKAAMVERDQDFPADFRELTGELDRTRACLAAGAVGSAAR